MGISVLLPCKNEEQLLSRQLLAILPQLTDDDELLMLDDCSTDRTYEIMNDLAGRHKIYQVSDHSMGVCNAYNFLAGRARCDWIKGSSGNDVEQAHSLQTCREAALAWPVAAVMFGNWHGGRPLDWGPQRRYCMSYEMPRLWVRCRGHKTHGAAAFLRRGLWGKGYIPGMRYMADWFQTWVLAARYGCVYLPEYISYVEKQAGSYSAAHADDAVYAEVMSHVRREIMMPEYADLDVAIRTMQLITGWLNESKSTSIRRI